VPLYYNSDTVLRIDPSDAVPLWKQIEDSIRRMVASGALAPGSELPSVRDVARDLRINPATVAKAYQKLRESGLVEVRRGEGTYVAEKPPSPPRGEKSREMGEAAAKFASVAITIGESLDGATRELHSAWKKLDRLKGDRR
jgi:GntR family transcriptional regulator